MAASVVDVANYILQKQGPMTAMKLQKLVYYSQAWSLVWDDKPLFPEPIEAWANGPVCPALYDKHRGFYQISRPFAASQATALPSEERETIDAVLGHYGDKSSQWLSELTHNEEPWRNARVGVPDGSRGNAQISHASMAEFYGAL